MGAETLRGGRPARLTASMADLIAAAVGNGATIEQAARAAGISRRSLFAWLAVGRRERASESVHLRLLRLVEQARAAAQSAGVMPMGITLSEESAPIGWEEAAAFLQQEHAGRWGPLDRALDELDALGLDEPLR